MDLTGKRVLITAAGQGIGFTTARLFTAAGAEVIASDINLERLQGCAGIRALALNVTDPAAIAAAAEAIGPIDVLFNCAGVVHSGSILDCSEDQWAFALDLNVTAMFRMIRAFLPGMLARGKGSIINMSSVASSVKGVPNRFAYGASKAAVIGLTRSVAADYVTQGIRCNAICPGTVESPSLRQRINEQAREQAAGATEPPFLREERMKLLRYGEPGQERSGMLDAQGRLRDLSQHIADVGGAALSPASLAKLRALDSAALPLVEGQPRLGACVGGIGKFICIGLNYADHAAETGAAIPEEPVVFNKWTSAVVGPYDRVEIPRGSQKTDWEVELGVVIGLGGRYISEADAMRHVAGYCVINDVSEREYQIERGGTWDKGKGCDTFGPIGPWLVTADEIADPHSLNLWLEVDGKRYQDGNTSTMIFRIPQIVSYLSRFMSLQPGDVISTGTPPGVGMGQKPQPIYLRAGQTMRLGIEGLGEQRQQTVQA
ncbi:3-oxoacyl-(acyl-carrier-protein) reductase [Acinetobacter baumannii]|nr:3-oxoacyl-(acyl-carrier-protein) reductase [Acinetobacter baumannii]